MEQPEAAHTQTGPLIMLDGPDGVGKSTQVEMATSALRMSGHEVYSARLSGGTAIGEALRKISLEPGFIRSAETDLHILLAMYYALADDLKPRRASGIICLIDRSPLSIIAYQVYGSGLPLDEGKAIVSNALELFKPDLILCYDDSEAALDAHRSKRENETGAPRDFFESQPPEYMHRVLEGYHEAVKMYDVQTVNASGSISDVHNETMQHIEKLLATV